MRHYLSNRIYLCNIFYLIQQSIETIGQTFMILYVCFEPICSHLLVVPDKIFKNTIKMFYNFL